MSKLNVIEDMEKEIDSIKTDLCQVIEVSSVLIDLSKSTASRIFFLHIIIILQWLMILFI